MSWAWYTRDWVGLVHTRLKNCPFCPFCKYSVYGYCGGYLLTVVKDQGAKALATPVRWYGANPYRRKRRGIALWGDIYSSYIPGWHTSICESTDSLSSAGSAKWIQSRCSNALMAEMCFQLQNITTWLDGNASYAWQRVFLLGAKDRPAPDYLHMRICVQTLM